MTVSKEVLRLEDLNNSSDAGAPSLTSNAQLLLQLAERCERGGPSRADWTAIKPLKEGTVATDFRGRVWKVRQRPQSESKPRRRVRSGRK